MDLRRRQMFQWSLAPAEAELRALLDETAPRSGPVYVHCALGHGRSALVVAAVLRRRGLATDVRDAERKVRQVRRVDLPMSRDAYAASGYACGAGVRGDGSGA